MHCVMATPGRRERVHYHHESGTEEILSPTLITVGGRCYRKLTEITFGRKKGVESLEDRTKKPIFTDDVYDEGEDTTVQLEGVEQTPGGGYVLHLPIPSVFFKYIIGREGRTKSNIEKDTKCRLRIPGKGKEGDIVLEGPSVANVADAKRRVEIVVWSNRLKEAPTHFISIPLNHPTIQERFKDFRDVVLTTCQKDRGIQPAVFQLPAKLHLTVAVMRLFSLEEEERAKEALKECITKALPNLGTDPVVISLRGVECMKDDPSAVDVLYAKVCLTDGTDRLQLFVDAIAEHFLEKAPDLMSREFEREGVKLHATVMNSKFPYTEKKDAVASSGYRGSRPRDSFDARGVFREQGDFHFGDISLETVHLSKRKEYGPDGYYKCIADYPISASVSFAS